MSSNQNYSSKQNNRFRFIIYNDATFEEVRSYRITRFSVVSLIATAVVFLMAVTFVLLAYTPLKILITGPEDNNIQLTAINNALRTDSLEYQLRIRNNFIENMKTIIEEREPRTHNQAPDTLKRYDTIDFSISKEDSMLRQQIEDQMIYSANVFTKPVEQTSFDITKIHFYTPVKGLVTSTFNLVDGHFGTDVAAAEGSFVHASHDGTVVLAANTLEAGYILEIQYEGNIVTLYKHLGKTLVELGDQVKAGTPIAVVGNSGVLTTGTHLHFELWHRGVPLDPQDYVTF